MKIGYLIFHLFYLTIACVAGVKYFFWVKEELFPWYIGVGLFIATYGAIIGISKIIIDSYKK